MAAPTGTGVVADYNIIREDLENVVYKISPLETPVFQSIGRKGAFENIYHEWPVVELAAPGENAQLEGDDATNNNPTTAQRLANYAQIMRKVKQVSDTSDAVRGAGDVQKMAKQVLYATQEIKRDMELAIANDGTVVANPEGATARHTASLSAFIGAASGCLSAALTAQAAGTAGKPGTMATVPAGTIPTTVVALNQGWTAPKFSTNATDPTLMNGYVAVAEVNTPNTTTGKTPLPIVESDLKTAIQASWVQGGNPTYCFVTGGSKVAISGFTGSTTGVTGNIVRFEEGDSRKLVTAIDVYESDFGRLQIVPDRFSSNTRVMIVDPGYAEIGWLQPMKNVPLAKTGMSTRRQISCEFGLVVGNPKAHAQVVGVAG